MTTLYIDVLLTVNMFIDHLLLTACAKVLSRPLTRRRHLLGAVIGSLFTLGVLLPPLPFWATALWQIAGAAAMVTAAFPFGSGALFFKTVSALYGIAAIFSGVITALVHFTAPHGLSVQNGVVYYDLPPLRLIVLTVIGYGVVCVYDRVTRKRMALTKAWQVILDDHGQQVTLRAMFDSGHSLAESFTGAPVILADATAIEPLRRYYDIHNLTAETASRMRYVPYATIGGEGVLAAFRPMRITLTADRRRVDITGCWVASVTTLGRGEYTALIGPSVTALFS